MRIILAAILLTIGLSTQAAAEIDAKVEAALAAEARPADKLAFFLTTVKEKKRDIQHNPTFHYTRLYKNVGGKERANR